MSSYQMRRANRRTTTSPQRRRPAVVYYGWARRPPALVWTLHTTGTLAAVAAALLALERDGYQTRRLSGPTTRHESQMSIVTANDAKPL